MKTRYKVLIILAVLVVILVIASSRSLRLERTQTSYPGGLGSSQESPLASKEASTVSDEATQETTGTSKTESRVVIKSGEFNLVVNNVENSVSQMIDYTEKNGGWIVSSNVTKINEAPAGTITVRVPVAKFETTMDYFSSLAVKIENEKREGEDVTEEYIDLKSQLRNLEATEGQLLKVMQRAKTISDILSVQREIKAVRGEIEETKGRILYIQRSAKMATITVNIALSEELLPVPSGERWKPQYVVKQAWKGVVAFWRNIAYLLIKIAIYGLVWIPILLAILIICRLRKKKYRNDKRKKK